MRVLLADLVHNYIAGTREGFASGNASGAVVPYGIASIGAYAKKRFGDTIEVSFFKFADELLAATDVAPPDVIAFSNYIWNSHLNLTIGTHLRQRFPDALIVVGGPSVRTDPKGIEQYLHDNPFIDVCVLHEGERPFAELLAQYQKSGKGFLSEGQSINSTAYFSSGRLIDGGSAKFGELDDFPSPYLEGVLDEFIARGLTPLFETNRGCPFRCTYCAWGVAALNKVRKFPLDRVLAELDWVSRKFPDSPGWIIGDGNFGMLPRDVEIAERIQTIRRKTPALRSVAMFASKNTPDRNIAIAELLRNTTESEGHQLDHALIALQTLDQAAQAATKRSNIKLGDVPKKVGEYHADGHSVRTDLLSGLPDETYEGHLQSLRDVFSFGFDFLAIYNVILLPGTEMESQSSRQNHRITTKYRYRDGAFGDYRGIKSVEAEEIIWGNSAITPDELLTLRMVHWAIWYGWNHGFLKPVLRYGMDIAGKNPADVLLQLVTCASFPRKTVHDFFESLKAEVTAEFFHSAEDLRKHYLSDNGWASVTTTHQRRAGFMYNAKLIENRLLYRSVLDVLRDILVDGDSTLYDELCELMLQARVDPGALYASDLSGEISTSISSDLLRCFLPRVETPVGTQQEIRLKKSIAKQARVRDLLRKNAYEQNAPLAISRTLAVVPDAFLYEIEHASSRAAVAVDFPIPIVVEKPVVPRKLQMM